MENCMDAGFFRIITHVVFLDYLSVSMEYLNGNLVARPLHYSRCLGAVEEVPQTHECCAWNFLARKKWPFGLGLKVLGLPLGSANLAVCTNKPNPKPES